MVALFVICLVCSIETKGTLVIIGIRVSDKLKVDTYTSLTSFFKTFSKSELQFY